MGGSQILLQVAQRHFAHLFTVSLLEHLTKHAGLVIIVQEAKGEVLWEHLWTLKQLPEDL